MHESLRDVPDRILNVALGALTQANQHSVYYSPHLDHWTDMSVLNAALAGELFLKAIIAKEHPLLIFRDLFHLDDPIGEKLTIEHVIEKGKTYGFEHLPKLLWVATGARIPDMSSFEKLRKARNSVQHFCSPSETVDLRRLSLEFLYKNVDPLINQHFGIFAINYHEDLDIGYDYVVQCLVGHELPFSIPDDFAVTEVDLSEGLADCSPKYRKYFAKKLASKGIDPGKFGLRKVKRT
jgi:hypothetical protein